MNSLVVVLLFFELGAAREFATAHDVDCGGTPIMAWDADSSSTNYGLSDSLQGCQSVCNSHPECAGFTYSGGQCFWSRSPLNYFPAPNKTCIVDTTVVAPNGASPKCTRPDEACRLDLMFQDAHPDANKRMMNYEFSGVTSGCLWRTYSRDQARKCLKDKWVLLLGGSNHHQYAESVFQFFYPCDNHGVFPCNIQNYWYWNMTSVGTWRLWTDMIIDADGKVIAFRTDVTNDIPTESGAAPWLREAAVAKFLNYTNTVSVPPGGTRITWVRCRWFPYVFPIVEMLRDRMWPNSPPPLIHISIGRWYGGGTWPREQIPTQLVSAVAAVRAKYPDITRIYIEDDPNTEPYIDSAVATAGPPALQYRARDLYTNTNRGYSAFIFDGHRTNALHSMLQQRFWGMQCSDDDREPIYYSRLILRNRECEPISPGGWNTQIYDACPHTNILFTRASGSVTAVATLPAQPSRFTSSDGGAGFDEEDNLPSVRNPDNAWGPAVTVIATVILVVLFALWYSPTLSFLAKYYCCPRFCGCHKRELKVLQRPAEVEEEGYEEVDLRKAAGGGSRRNTAVGRRATQAIEIFTAKPDYLGPNAKKRYMGGMEGYDFVDEDSQFQTSGLQQHSRKTVAAKHLAMLGARPPPPRSAGARGPPPRPGGGTAGPPPPPPPPPPAPAAPAAVEMQSATQVAPVTKEPAKPKRRHLDAFGFARFCASVHVVCGHLVRKSPPPVEPWYTSDWGYTWVPWFMMLSGFILTYARLGSSKPDQLDPPYKFFFQRARSVYPLYLSSLFCAAALDSYIRSRPFRLGTWYESIMSILLLQAWDPNITETVYQSHCWFLSCILPYWLVHNYLYRFLKARDSKFLWGIAIFVSLWPWVFLMLIPGAMGKINWFNAHQSGRNDTWVDTLTIMLKFHPVFYLPVYVFGMVVAILFIRKGDDLNWVLRNGAVLGYAGLFFVFIATPWMGTKPYNGIPAAKLSCRLGVLAPLQGLSLVGLAVGKDPLARLFSWLPLQLGERLSFPQYVFQFIVFTLWAQYTALGYWSLLMLFSLCGAVFIQEPLARPTKDRRRKLFALLAMILAPFICLLLLIISGNALYFPPPGHLPDFVSYGEGAYDTKLNLAARPYQPLDGTYASEFAFANPSFITATHTEMRNFSDGNTTNMTMVTVQDLFVTARRFRLDIVTDKTSVIATEDGDPIYRAPVCQFFDPLQGCQGLTVITAIDAADCQATCCGLSNCRAFIYLKTNGTSPATCNVHLANVPVNCTDNVLDEAVLTGIKMSPLFPFNSSANNNATAFWHTINASGTQTSTWRSDIVFGVLNQSTMASTCPLEVLPVSSGVSNSSGVWYPCTPHGIYSEINNTMFQLVSTGPEDARLFKSSTGYFLSFTSNIPTAMPMNNMSLPPNCLNGSGMQFFSTSLPPTLMPTWQAYITNQQCPAPSIFNATLNETAAPTPQFNANLPVPTQYRLGTDLRVPQKNWIAVPYASQTLFIVSIDPFQVVTVSGGSTSPAGSYRNVLISNTAILQNVVFHGGSNAIRVKSQPIPPWAVTWDTLNSTAPTPAPVPTPAPASICVTPFVAGSYAQSVGQPTNCTLNGGSFDCTGGYVGSGSISGAQITFTNLFNSTSIIGYWMTDAYGNCQINFGDNRYWSYQPVPPAPQPPDTGATLTAEELAFRKYYYLTRPDFYMAAFHTVDSAGRYRNYLMELETTLPFKILRLSNALPLLEYPIPQPGFQHGVRQKMAFLSTVAELENGNFAFGYGSSNYQARALVLSREQYETMFSQPIPGRPT